MSRQKQEKPKPRASEQDARSRILDAAVEVFRDDGVRALTQTRVAAKAGLRQSHLTYYFPKKSDLLAATLQETHLRAGRSADSTHAAKQSGDALDAVATLMFDRAHMRAFLALVVEASEAEETRRIVDDHARGFAAELAPHFGRAAGDPDVEAFVDLLRGLGLRALLAPQAQAPVADVEALAARFGLKRARKA
jgi:AcrR family transcriptional regulator